MQLSAPVWKLAAELLEMRYLWNLPHSLDGTRLKELLPDYRDTPLDEFLRASLDTSLATETAGKRLTA